MPIFSHIEMLGPLTTYELMRNDLPKSGVYYWLCTIEVCQQLGIPIDNDYVFYCDTGNNRYYLLYIGICPRDENSSATLAKRFGLHTGVNISQSTFRKAIAALMGYPHIKREGDLGVSREHNSEINHLLCEHFKIFVEGNKFPWNIEKERIRSFQPPLNSQHNTNGWYYRNIKEARKAAKDNAQ